MPGRNVVVTGASRGIGEAIAQAFHSSGDSVVAISRSTGVNAPRERWTHVAADVRRPAEIRSAIREAAREGAIDVLVNNAGSSGWRSLERIDEAFWQDMLATNLTSTLFASQAAIQYMRQGSVIVNVSSIAGKRGSARNAAYCAAKFGVDGITQALAKELGARGVRVNAVCPVYVRTPGLDTALREDDAPPAGGDVDAYLSEFARSQAALGRLPTAAEVAAACVWLASAAASAVTGQCINVDCGVLPQ